MSLTDADIDAMMRERVQPIAACYAVEFDALAWLDSHPDIRDALRGMNTPAEGMRLLQGHIKPHLEELNLAEMERFMLSPLSPQELA